MISFSINTKDSPVHFNLNFWIFYNVCNGISLWMIVGRAINALDKSLCICKQQIIKCIWVRLPLLWSSFFIFYFLKMSNFFFVIFRAIIRSFRSIIGETINARQKVLSLFDRLMFYISVLFYFISFDRHNKSIFCDLCSQTPQTTILFGHLIRNFRTR